MAVVLGSGLLVPVGAARAQTKKAQNLVESKAVARTDKEKNAYLVDLEPRLREVLGAIYPGVRIECNGDNLVATLRQEKFATHLSDSRGTISAAPAAKFPADFAEFSILLGVERDIMHYRPYHTALEIPEAFGTTFVSRYNLKIAPIVDVDNEFKDVPLDHWAYNDYKTLAQAAAKQDPAFAKEWMSWDKPMNRYLFALLTFRLLSLVTPEDKGQQKGTNSNGLIHDGFFDLSKRLRAQPDPTEKEDGTLVDAWTALSREFAPELSGFKPSGGPLEIRKPFFTRPSVHGQAWQPRYDHLSLRFSYGPGVSPVLVARIKQVVAEYAAKKLSENPLVG